MARIKILFLAANPLDSVRLRLDEESREIELALRKSRFRDSFLIEKQFAVRIADLQDHLMHFQPDIVHFSSHGSHLSEIMLENETGKSTPVPARALNRLFAVLKGNVRCVVLNACYSQKQARAIARHIDCVVGISKAIGDESAIGFSKAFYLALGYGKDVKTAFELGRLEIDLQDLKDHEKPKLLAFNEEPRQLIFVTEATPPIHSLTNDIKEVTADVAGIDTQQRIKSVSHQVDPTEIEQFSEAKMGLPKHFLVFVVAVMALLIAVFYSVRQSAPTGFIEIGYEGAAVYVDQQQYTTSSKLNEIIEISADTYYDIKIVWQGESTTRTMKVGPQDTLRVPLTIGRDVR